MSRLPFYMSYIATVQFENWDVTKLLARTGTALSLPHVLIVPPRRLWFVVKSCVSKLFCVAARAR